MFKKLKTKSIFKSLNHILIFLGMGIGAFIVLFSEVKMLLNGAVNFESLKPVEIKDEILVDASISINLGAFLAEYEKSRIRGTEQINYVYYIISTGDVMDEDSRYMAIKVPAADKAAMDALEEAYGSGEASKPIKYTGPIRRMSEEEYKHFVYCFTRAGWTEEAIDDYTLPYYIDAGAFTGKGLANFCFGLILGSIFIFIGLFLCIRAMKGKLLKEFKEELSSLRIGEMEAETAYEAANQIEAGSDFRLGQRFVFFFSYNKPHVVLKDKIIWIYLKKKVRKRYGISVRKTYEVILVTKDSHCFEIKVDTEQAGQKIIQCVTDELPWVVAGYNNELEEMFRLNKQDFFNLKYNQNCPVQE